MTEQNAALSPGIVIEGYAITSELGRGSFGITYRGLDLSLNRQVAIKEYMPEDYARRDASGNVTSKAASHGGIFEKGLVRFCEEAQVLARFSHPNIVRVQRLIQGPYGTAFIVMDLLSGTSLEAVVKQHGPLPYSRFRDVFVDLLDGCAAIHKHGLLHRDIKPTNVMITDDDRAVLIDFGSARDMQMQDRRPHTRIISDGYSPKEQYSLDQRQGPHTDIYSVAATSYFALTGEDPPPSTAREGKDSIDLLKDRVAGRAPPRVLEVLDQGLALESADRPQSAEVWKQAFLEADKPVAVKPGMTRAQLLSLGLAAGGVAVAGGAGFFAFFGKGGPSVSGASKALKVAGRRVYGDVIEDPFAKVVGLSDGALVAAHELSNLTAMRVNQIGEPQGKVFKQPESGTSGRALLNLPNGDFLVGGLADMRREGRRLFSSTTVSRIGRDGSVAWTRKYGDGAVTDLIRLGGRIYFSQEAADVAGSARITAIDEAGNQLGAPIELASKSGDAVQRIAAGPDGSMAVVLSRAHADGQTSETVITRVRLGERDARELWTETDGDWANQNKLKTTWPFDLVFAAGDIFVAGAAVSSREEGFGEARPYLMRLDGETGEVRWRRVGVKNRGRDDPRGMVRAIVATSDPSPRLYIGEMAPRDGVSRISQIDGDGQVVNAVVIGSAIEPFLLTDISVTPEGAYAVGWEPRPNAQALALVRLDWA